MVALGEEGPYVKSLRYLLIRSAESSIELGLLHRSSPTCHIAILAALAAVELRLVVVVVDEEPATVVRLVQPMLDSFRDHVKILTLHGGLEREKSWMPAEDPRGYSCEALLQG